MPTPEAPTIAEHFSEILSVLCLLVGALCSIIGALYMRDLRRNDSDTEKIVKALDLTGKDLAKLSNDLTAAQTKIATLESEKGVYWTTIDALRAEIRNDRDEVIRLSARCEERGHCN